MILSFVSRCNGTSTVVLYEPVRPYRLHLKNWQNTARKVKESRLGYSIQPNFVVRGTIHHGTRRGEDPYIVTRRVMEATCVVKQDLTQ